MFQKSFLRIGLVAITLFNLVGAEDNNQLKVIDATDKDFEEIVLKSDKPVIVDFNAEWCGPCKNVKPIFEFLAEKHWHKYRFVSVNIDKAPATSQKYSVEYVPLFAVFNNGQICGFLENGVQVNSFEQETQQIIAGILKDKTERKPIADETLLIAAVSSQNIEQLKQILQKDVNLDHIYSMTMPIGKDAGKEFEYTALSIALSLGNHAVVKMLLDAGATIDLTLKQPDGQQLTARQLLEKSRDEFNKTTNDMITFLNSYGDESNQVV